MTSLSLFTFLYWRGKWQPTAVFLPGESQGRGRLVRCRLWGRTESDTTEQQQHYNGKGILVTSFYFLYITWHCLGQSYLCIFLFPLCLLLLECLTDKNRSTVYLSYQAIPRTGLGHQEASLRRSYRQEGKQTQRQSCQGSGGGRQVQGPCGGWTGGGFETRVEEEKRGDADSVRQVGRGWVS